MKGEDSLIDPNDKGLRTLARNRAFWGRLLIISFLLFVLVPIVGVMWTMHVFYKYSPSIGQNGYSLDEALAQFSFLENVQRMGSIVCLAAFVTMVISIVRFVKVNSQVKLLHFRTPGVLPPAS